MSSLLESTHNLMQVFSGKLEDFLKEIDDVHMVWLEEIEQEAQRMFSSDFNTEPELMPKTPSQKKTNRRRRVSVGQNENKAKRRLSKGKRSNLRRSSVQLSLNAIPESPSASAEPDVEEPQRRTRRNNAKSAAEQGPVKRSTRNKPTTASASLQEVDDDTFEEEEPIQEEEEAPVKAMETESANSAQPPQVSSPTPAAVESEEVEDAQVSKATVVPDTPQGPPSRTSVRRSMTARHSLAGLRRSLTQEAVRRASRRSFLKKKARMSRSACSSSVGEDICLDTDGEEVEEMEREEKVGDVEEPGVIVIESSPVPEINVVEPDVEDSEEKEGGPEAVKPGEPVTRYTRSMAKNTPTPTAAVSVSRIEKPQTPPSVSGEGGKTPAGTQSMSRFGFKRRVDSTSEDVPKKKISPKNVSQSAVKPNMKSFIHTVQKNQLLMMTPGSLGRSSVMSFIKHGTPGRVDPKLSIGLVERERQKLEAYNKKTEQENERKKKMEEDRRKKNEELKRQREERLRRVLEARERGEKAELEKRKKVEQKMAQINEKEKAKKTVASKRQQELELRRKQEEDARKRKLQQEEEEKRQQELRAKRKAEEEERARKLADARRQLELKREQEREQERRAAAERQEKERQEREKALALQLELERAAREKERRELEEKRRLLEEKRQREDEQRRAEEERRRVAAATAAAAAAQEAQLKATASKTTLLNTTINKGPALNVTVDLEGTLLKTPLSKGAALLSMSHKGALNVTVDVENSVMKTPVGTTSGLNSTVVLDSNVTLDVENSPQSYEITPKGKKITTLLNPEDYGMDQNSDDSTDDESAPKKPIPSWAEGLQLQQAIMKQYYDPVDLHAYFGVVEMPKLERIFHKSKPRFFKRTSSAVWHSPPRMGSLSH
ncbi:inner centromere protein isoform X2 [Alosa sapidissima]|uniref:inner centromere protein isoform X2 n=1 Tax=Alosa sapidissima TaxID=34773 RepID=UPI001C081CB2|nr:inner centromere protein isoform X2 [Alosa sapidissima]